MKKVCFLFSCFVIFTSAVACAEQFSGAVVFRESGFPVADSAAPPAQWVEGILPGARLASTDELPGLLKDMATHLLVLPYGSAFPEQAWADIFGYLQRGGNLVVIGGRPFSRSGYKDGGNWKLRDYSVRFMRPLMIDQYQTTPASDGLEFHPNPDMTTKLTAFHWQRGFSPIIRLSAVDLYKRGGAAGSLDARLDTFAWGVKNGHRLVAPAIEVDHLRNGFTGGRWVFLDAELTPDFFSENGTQIARALAQAAMRGAEEFSVTPVLPLYLPGETVQLDVHWQSLEQPTTPLTIKIVTYPQDSPSDSRVISANVPTAQPVVLPAPTGKGLYVVDAQLLEGDQVRSVYHSGFWIRDETYLRTGPKLSVNHDYFELDGKPLAVVGTTYMSSEVQRLYFEHPNVYVWNRDLGQIHDSGLNMIRSGWWTGWDKLCDENGQPYERTLRTMEAFLMTAHKNGLPVQFNFFAFLPDVLAGKNSYLDPETVRRQKTLISAVVTRFHDVSWLAWDFINEPSIGQQLWKMRPNGDPIELQKWNDWLANRYPDLAALAAAWNVPASAMTGAIPLPEEVEFTDRGMYVGHNSTKVYDFFLFAQDVFADWVKTMRDAVRATGSQQLVTVGQDEGGIQDRLSPAFWGPLVSFTTNHSWWQIDFSLWDSLMAKQPGETMLIQETGLQRELNMDEVARRTPQNEAALLERKIASSFIQGSGAIEWLWNTNSYMTESNETPIGAVLPDGTEKPEAALLRNYAGFSKSLSEHLRAPEQPAIALVTSQATQFSVLGDMQLEAQRKAVRALAYYDRLTLYAIAENQIDRLGSPKLAILPSPQALSDSTWRALLQYANRGGNLLITGPVERNEHWGLVSRVADLKLDAELEPLTYHNASIQLEGRSIPLAFNQQDQNWLGALRFGDGSTLKQVPYGKGRIFWAAYPIELAEGAQATADLYSYVAKKVGIEPMFDLLSPLSAGVLVFPTVMQDSVLYVVVSDGAEDSKVDLRDKTTGAHLTIPLASQHAAMAVIGKQSKTVVAKYGF